MSRIKDLIENLQNMEKDYAGFMKYQEDRRNLIRKIKGMGINEIHNQSTWQMEPVEDCTLGELLHFYVNKEVKEGHMNKKHASLVGVYL
jgi:hypothetical protein